MNSGAARSYCTESAKQGKLPGLPGREAAQCYGGPGPAPPGPGGGMHAPLLCCFLCTLWAGGLQFELQDMIRELRSENAMLHAKVENLTEVLMELKLYIWNHSRDWDSEAEERIQEHVLCKQDYGPNASSPGNLPMPGLVFAMLILIGLLLKSAVNARAIVQDAI